MKKNPKDFDALTKEFYEITKEKGIDQKFTHYVWNVLISMSKGYGFNQSHTLAYSLIALQEMNLAYKYPTIFWDCACLISDAGGDESDENEVLDEADLTNEPEIYYNEIEEFGAENDEEDDEEDEDEDDSSASTSPKKKNKKKSARYGKIASAIGKIKSEGVTIFSPDINDSTFTFSPDVDNNAIIFGLSGITRIGQDLIQSIIANRPYTSIEDFLGKVKVNKPQMVNLIKCGAFDSFGKREQLMYQYIKSVSKPKSRVTLQNMQMLIDFNLIPDEYDLQRRAFNFNKYAKKNLGLDSDYYAVDVNAYRFLETEFGIDKFETTTESETGFKIKKSVWESIYKRQQDIIRPWVKKNGTELLDKINRRLVEELWEKYCTGSLSKWEMDSISCYEHEHELGSIAPYYEFDDFFSLPEEPEVDRFINIKGKQIPLFKLHRITGTVLDRDKNKKLVTVLTTTGVVTIKIYGGAFSNYDKQLSEKGIDGHKHVIEKSWFSRGNKLIFTGIRNGDAFVCKKYKSTPFHLVEKIEEINEEGNLKITHGREVE